MLISKGTLGGNEIYFLGVKKTKSQMLKILTTGISQFPVHLKKQKLFRAKTNSEINNQNLQLSISNVLYKARRVIKAITQYTERLAIWN